MHIFVLYLYICKKNKGVKLTLYVERTLLSFQVTSDD
jgi:hypothetical protein